MGRDERKVETQAGVFVVGQDEPTTDAGVPTEQAADRQGQWRMLCDLVRIGGQNVTLMTKIYEGMGELQQAKQELLESERRLTKLTERLEESGQRVIEALDAHSRRAET